MIDIECDTIIIGDGTALSEERRRRGLLLKIARDLRTRRVGAVADPLTWRRLIDASIIPEVRRTDTHLTTVAIAQCVADSLEATA